MNNLIKLILSMSLSGSVLILIIMALRPILKNRFSKAWQYYVWIVVVMRLVIPFTPETGLINELFQKNTASPSVNLGVPVVITPEASQVNPSSVSASLPAADLTSPVHSPAPFKLPQLWEIATLVWLTGMILLLFIKVMKYLQFTYMVRLASVPVKDEKLSRLLKKTAAEFKIRKTPELYVNDYISSPMMIDIFKPNVYLTKETLSMETENLSFVLRHELMHYKRRDLWYKWICELTSCIHWFNPFVGIMIRQINSQCETSCDEAVARDFSSYEKLAYGNMLINAATINTKYHSILSTTLYEDKKNVKERLQSVLNAGRKSNRTMTMSFIMAILLCVVAAYLGTYSESGKNSNANAADNNPVVSEDAAGQKDQAETLAADTSAVTSGTDQSVSQVSADQTDADNKVYPANDPALADSSDSEEAAAPTSGAVPTLELPLIYDNTDYGFQFALPESWKGYTVYDEVWQGTALSGDQINNVVEMGPIIYIRHPDWTTDNPRQDIPIMVFTTEQWELVINENIAVSAAPVPPALLGSNSKYVFAIPARYNFAYPTGYEEVDQIFSSNALRVTDKFK